MCTPLEVPTTSLLSTHATNLTTATAAPTRGWLQGWLPCACCFTVQRRRCMGEDARLPHPALDPDPVLYEGRA